MPETEVSGASVARPRRTGWVILAVAVTLFSAAGVPGLFKFSFWPLLVVLDLVPIVAVFCYGLSFYILRRIFWQIMVWISGLFVATNVVSTIVLSWQSFGTMDKAQGIGLIVGTAVSVVLSIVMWWGLFKFSRDSRAPLDW